MRRLTDCSESEAAAVASRLRDERATRERQDAFAAALSLRGVPAARDRNAVNGMRYLHFVPNPAEVADLLPEEFEEGQVVALLQGKRCELYVTPELMRESTEESELRQQVDAFSAAFSEMDEARDAWFWEGLATGRAMPNVKRECTYGFETSFLVKDALDEIPKEARVAAKNKGLSLYDFAIGYRGMRKDGTYFARPLAKGELEGYRKGNASEYLDTLTMFQADGWDPGDGVALIAKLSALVDGKEDDEND